VISAGDGRYIFIHLWVIVLRCSLILYIVDYSSSSDSTRFAHVRLTSRSCSLRSHSPATGYSELSKNVHPRGKTICQSDIRRWWRLYFYTSLRHRPAVQSNIIYLRARVFWSEQISLTHLLKTYGKVMSARKKRSSTHLRNHWHTYIVDYIGAPRATHPQ